MSSGPIHACSVCGQSYWSMGAVASNGTACPECVRAAVPTVEPATTEPGEPVIERPRFVSLSALPPEKRLPPRRETGFVVPRRPGEVKTPAPVVAEEEHVEPPHAAPPPLPAPVSLSVPRIEFHQLGFNCPSCYTVLVIKDPDYYDGRAAPCPHCHVTILPPRVMPPTPFTLIGYPSDEAVAARLSRRKTPPRYQLEDTAPQAEVV